MYDPGLQALCLEQQVWLAAQRYGAYLEGAPCRSSRGALGTALYPCPRPRLLVINVLDIMVSKDPWHHARGCGLACVKA